MNKFKFALRIIAVLGVAILILSPVATQIAYAHGQVEVGDYEIELGWHNEPAFLGEVNGMEFFVTNTKTGEPVNGLENTLQLEITFGASTRELNVEPQDEVEGGYISYVIPTEEGDYTAHLWGDIEGTAVDVTMTSSPDTFDTVESNSAFAFPGTLTTVNGAQNQAQTALIVGGLGVVLGLLGIGLTLTKRSKK